MFNKLLQSLKNYIENLEDGGIINLVSFIEDEGIEVSDCLLIELFNGIKDKNVKRAESLNDVVISIKVFGK